MTHEILVGKSSMIGYPIYIYIIYIGYYQPYRWLGSINLSVSILKQPRILFFRPWFDGWLVRRGAGASWTGRSFSRTKMTSFSFSNLFCWNWLDHAGSTSRSVFQSKPSSGGISGFFLVFVQVGPGTQDLHGPWVWGDLLSFTWTHTRFFNPLDMTHVAWKRVHRRWNSTTQINRKTMSWTSHNPWNKDPVIYNTRTTWKVDGQATKPSLMTSFMSQNSNQWSWHSSHEMLGQKTWTTSFNHSHSSPTKRSAM